MSEADLREERIRKLAILRSAGVDPYPAVSERDTSVADFLSDFDNSATSTRTVAGRIMASRGQGGIVFVDFFDGTGRMQGVLQRSDLAEPFDLFVQVSDIGDFIEFEGIPYMTKRGERSILVSKWRMLAKSLIPIPAEWYGLKDGEKILRERYLDILMNEEVRAMFVRREKFWSACRAYLKERDFLEVETPVLETMPGGADARPFVTHHHALDIDVSLRISLELSLKRLLVAGYPKVFEIGRIFRNEGQSREHLQDYTQLETYEAYSDMRKGKEFITELYRRIVQETYGKYSFEMHGHTVDFADEWKELDFCALISDTYGIDPLTCSESEAIQAVRGAHIEVGEELNLARAIDHLWKALRKGVAGPAFLINIPVYLEPLAKRSSEDSRVVERVQVVIAGSEMGKGFSELNDPEDQRARFEEQQKMRDAGDEEAQRLDLDYVRALEYGMPPAFGFGVSERLFAFLENRPAHEAQIFPLMRPLKRD